MHAVYCKFTLYFDYNRDFYPRLDLTRSGQVDLTAATLGSTAVCLQTRHSKYVEYNETDTACGVRFD